MRLYLDTEGLEMQAQTPGLQARLRTGFRRFHHPLAERFPIELGPRGHMRVVIANRTVHLGQYPHSGDAVACGLQTHHDVGDFLADGCRAGGLAMGTAEHRHVGISAGHFPQLEQQPVQPWQHYDVTCRT